MSNRIVVASQKGGVGKTTICLNLGVALAESGRRTLVVDLDPQGAIGLSLARGETEWSGLADVLAGQSGLEEAIVRTKLSGFDILARGRLSPLDAVNYEAALSSPDGLVAIFEQLKGEYDYILIDTPPGVGAITRAALDNGDFVLVPVQAEPLGLRSVSQLLMVVDHTRSNNNPGLNMLGFCPTMVELNNPNSLDVMQKLWGGFSGVLDTAIPRSDVINMASAEGIPISHLGGPLRPETRRFAMLASEIENRIREMGATEGDEDERPRRELL